jgi:hypothetical protein
MVLQGDMGQVVARFGPHGDIVNLSARQVYGFHRMYHGRVIFGHIRRYSYVTCVKWKLISFPLEIVLI